MKLMEKGIRQGEIRKKAIRQKEKGMITVEAVLSLVPFIMVILGIISFINIFAVHNKIQFALYQIGGELSGYTYLYQALGIRAADLKLKEDADTNTEKLDGAIEEMTDFLEQINTFESSLNQLSGSTPGDITGNLDNVANNGQQVIEGGQHMVQTVRDLASDPKGLLRAFVYLATEKAESALKTLLLGEVSRALVKVYLDESFSQYAPGTADDYLRHYGVKGGVNGLDFGKSRLFDDNNYRMIDIVVEYDIEVYFFKLFLKDPTIHVVQRCPMSAWLDGDGVVMEK